MSLDDPLEMLARDAPRMRSEVLDRLRTVVREENAPARARSRAWRLVYSGALSLALVALLSAPRILRGHDATLGVLALVSFLSVGLVLYPALPREGRTWLHFGAPGRRRLLGAALALVFVFFSFWAEEFHSPGHEELGRSSLACAMHGLGRGLLALLPLLLFWRHTDPFVPRTTAALLGFAAGALGVAATTVACPIHEGFHLLLGHALVVSVTAGAGALLGPKILPP